MRNYRTGATLDTFETLPMTHLKTVTNFINLPIQQRTCNQDNLINIKLRQKTFKQQCRFGLLNAQSICNKVDRIKSHVLDNNLDICAFTETWLKDGNDYECDAIKPDGYNFHHVDRQGKIGGGVGILSKKCYHAKIQKSTSRSSFEHMKMSIISDTKLVFVLVIYRPPCTSLALFLEEFSCLLEETTLQHDNVLLIGDFNIHKDQENGYMNKFGNIMSAFSLLQHVTQPTNDKGHILDLVISREKSDVQVSKVRIDTPFSDHYAISFDLSINKKINDQKKISFRKISNIDLESLKSDISKSPICLSPSEDICTLVDQYNSSLSALLEKHAPLQNKVLSSKNNEPWYDNNIREIKLECRRAERKWRKSKTEENCQAFRQINIKLNKSIQSSKSKYYTDLISNETDKKKLFQHFSRIMNKKNATPLPEHTSAEELANDFNSFFKSKIDSIRSNFVDNKNDQLRYDIKAKSTLENFKTWTEQDVKKLITSMPNKSCALDPLPTKLVKECVDELVPSITKLINISLSEGCIPSKLKEAIITPLLKKQNAELTLKNYRPVSNLAYISKLIEKAVAEEMLEYIAENGLTIPLQSAYKARHSTETALIKVFNDILTQIDDQKVVFLSLLDLSAAFDTVDHSILLQRLEHTFGFKGTVLKWFSSYLNDRTQKVLIEGKTSTSATLNCSVPQGSVLGAHLYSNYVSPLGNLLALLCLLFHLYADDTQLMKVVEPNSVQKQHESISQLETGIMKVGSWMKDNKLQLNRDKTEFMIIGTKNQLKKMHVDSITLGDEIVRKSSEVRNLGVYMDSELSMVKHVTNLCKTCYYHIRNIYKIRRFLTMEATKTLVHATIINRLDYCNSLLYGLPENLIGKLQKVQNASARLITGLSKYDHITAALKDLHWLPIAARIKYKICIITFKSRMGLTPNYIAEMLMPYHPSRPLRSAGECKLVEERFKLSTYGNRAFSNHAPSLWNQLPDNLKNETSFTKFKKDLKTELFEKAYCQ